MRGSATSITSSGTIATPSPAATSAWMIALLSKRLIDSGATPRASSCSSTKRYCWQPRMLRSPAAVEVVEAALPTAGARHEHVRVIAQSAPERAFGQRQRGEIDVDFAALDRAE